MRRPFIAGNWKMNLDHAGAAKLASEVAKQAADVNGVDVAVCPAMVHIDAVRRALEGTSLPYGAQNMHFEGNGAYTGETSAAMLVDLGCRYVILGHSERRQFFGETDEIVARKTVAALAAGLGPIVCVGELLAERESNQTTAVITRQFHGSLEGVTAEQMPGVVIAYEPVWAIGTGKVASPEQAEEVHALLRNLLAERYNSGVAESVRIQYGGSVKPSNAAELLSQPNVDGALVGGASLKADDFMGIISAATP